MPLLAAEAFENQGLDLRQNRWFETGGSDAAGPGDRNIVSTATASAKESRQGFDMVVVRFRERLVGMAVVRVEGEEVGMLLKIASEVEVEVEVAGVADVDTDPRRKF